MWVMQLKILDHGEDVVKKNPVSGSHRAKQIAECAGSILIQFEGSGLFSFSKSYVS